MHFSRFSTLAFAGLGLASPSASAHSRWTRDAATDASLSPPHNYAEINLDEFEGWDGSANFTGNGLGKRRAMDICRASAARAGNCIAVTGVVSAVALGIASLVKSDSNANDCTLHKGSVDNVTWQAFATGRNCDTTAQLNTIQGAVTVYLNSVGNNVCGVHCLKLSHGGTYVGYVTIADAGENLNTFYCGASNSFGNCVSGGDNDT